MNRYVLSAALAALLGILCPVSSRAASIFVLPAVGNTVGQPVTVEVDLSLDAGEFLTAFQIDILFPSFLQADSVTELGPFALGGCCFYGGTIDNTALTITSIYDALAGPDPLGSSTTPLVVPLVQLSFTALDFGVGAIGVDPTTAQLIDPSFNDLVLTGNPAVDVAITTSTPEPSAGLFALTGLALLAIVRKVKQSGSARAGLEAEGESSGA
jgi:hypothetical protein